MPLVLATLLLNGCWFQPGWGPSRGGHNPNEDRLTPANASTLALTWSVDLGADAVLEPVTSVHGVHVVAGHTVTTVGLDDGEVRWTYAPDLAPLDTVGSPSLGKSGNEADVWLYVPAIIFDPPDNQFLYGVSAILDPATGTMMYGVGAGDNGSIAVDGPYSVSVARVVRFSGGEEFVSVILTYSWYGQWRWRTGVAVGQSDTPAATPAALGRDRIVFGFGSQVKAFTRVEPEFCEGGWCPTVWARDLGGTATMPILSNATETVYVGDASGAVTAMSLVDGSVRWEADLGGDRGVLAPPTLGNGQLYVTSSDGHLYAFDAEGCGAATCDPTWEADTGSPVRKQAALAGGVLHVGTEDGAMLAFDAEGCGAPHCDPLWSTSVGSRISGGPIVTNGHLIVGTEDGRLLAYRPS